MWGSGGGGGRRSRWQSKQQDTAINLVAEHALEHADRDDQETGQREQGLDHAEDPTEALRLHLVVDPHGVVDHALQVLEHRGDDDEPAGGGARRFVEVGVPDRKGEP